MKTEDMIQKIYPLAPMQEGILFQGIINNDKKEYCEQVTFRLHGILDIKCLEESLNLLIQRHEILRTIFIHKGQTRPRQIVLKQAKIKCYVHDWTSLDKTKQDKQIELLMVQDRNQGFNLSKEISIRANIAALKPDESLLLLSFHHILLDGWSLPILFKDLFEIYDNIAHKITPHLEHTTAYSEYIKWLERKDKAAVLEYWKDYLANYEEVCIVPSSKKMEVSTYHNMNKVIELDEAYTEKLANIAKQYKVTVNSLFQAIWAVILGRYNNTDDVVFGTVVSGRHFEIPSIEKMVGLFINTLPIRIRLEAEKSFNTLMQDVQKDLVSMNENDTVQLSEIQATTSAKQKLINNIVVFENYPFDNNMDNYSPTGMHIEREAVVEQTNYSFNIVITMTNKISINFKYNACIYSEQDIAFIIGHVKQVLTEVVENPNVMLKDIRMITKEETEEILSTQNIVEIDYPKHMMLHQLFEKQVAQHPNNIALSYENENITYEKLNNRANQLAHELRAQGVKREEIVAVFLERSVEMIVAILAILKAGAAYLPIDTKLPSDRVKFMLQDAQVNVVCTNNKNAEKLQDIAINKLNINNSEIQLRDKNNLECINKPEDLAYIIYTSGTTGKPKGVMIQHYNVVRLMFNDKMPFEFSENDIWTMFHSYCFDFSVWEMYGALLYGGKLVIVPEALTKDFKQYLELLKKEEVTVLNQTPTAFNNLISIETNLSTNDLSLRYIIFGGEALKPRVLAEWKNKYPQTKIINMYGITETTVHVTYKEITTNEIESGISNIGKAIPTLSTYIMNSENGLLPIGVPGELCVGGLGVGRGYLNREELSKEKFVMNPYRPQERLYKSGDLVRLLANGEMEYLGRIDQQVKVRGFRIELGEIESRMLSYPNIQDVVVVAKQDQEKETYLCAYVVTKKESLNRAQIKDYLQQMLPSYMVPAYFMELEKLPMTINGKVDKKALPEPDVEGFIQAQYEEPRNSIDECLVKIWCEVLGLKKVGIKDNFFDIGGHSLKAMTLIGKINKQFKVEIPLKLLFSQPTVEGISNYISRTTDKNYLTITSCEKQEYYDVSAAQRRMYLLQQTQKDTIAYNIYSAYELIGNVNLSKIENAFVELIKRHEALRTTFKVINGEIKQQIEENVAFNIDFKEQDEEINVLMKQFVKSFDMTKAPLFKVQIVKSYDRYYLLIDMHHIISDGTSMNILIQELVKLYNNETLETLKLQYKDYANWQYSEDYLAQLKNQEAYWLAKFNKPINTIHLPYDYELDTNNKYEGNTIEFLIDPERTSAIKELARKMGCTTHMFLFTVFNVLLAKYSMQEDLVIGIPVAGRKHPDIQNIVGMFVNTLAIRTYVDDKISFDELLNQVKENLIHAYENQDYEFEALVETLGVKRKRGENPLFNVMFDMSNTDYSTPIELGDCTLKQCSIENEVSKFNLTLSVVETDECFKMSYEYCIHLFKNQTIEKAIQHLLNIIDSVIENCHITIDMIDISSKEEKGCLVEEVEKIKNIQVEEFDFS